MNNRIELVVLLCLTIGFISCSSSDDLVGNWVKSTDFQGPVRGYASCFVVNGKAYVVGGYGGYNGKQRLKDVWEFNIGQNYWTQKADFGGDARSSAFSFASENRGYYGTGYSEVDNVKVYYSDFWEYDPDGNIWTKKADFPAGSRYGATGFYLKGVGYAGTGFDGSWHMDFYKYYPQTNTWETGVSTPSKRVNATNFIINDKAYLVGGASNGVYLSDFYMFDPDTQTWVQKAHVANKTDDSFDDDYTTIVRENTVALVIDGFGYLSTGSTSGLNSYTWEYNPVTDRWKERTSFEGSSRTGAVGFSINNRGFVLTGAGSTSSSTSTFYDDMWELKPKDEYNKYD